MPWAQARPINRRSGDLSPKPIPSRVRGEGRGLKQMPQGKNDKAALLPPGVGEGKFGELDRPPFIEEDIDVYRPGAVCSGPDAA